MNMVSFVVVYNVSQVRLKMIIYAATRKKRTGNTRRKTRLSALCSGSPTTFGGLQRLVAFRPHLTMNVA
jgi:hypothetical protein